MRWHYRFFSFTLKMSVFIKLRNSLIQNLTITMKQSMTLTLNELMVWGFHFVGLKLVSASTLGDCEAIDKDRLCCAFAGPEEDLLVLLVLRWTATALGSVLKGSVTSILLFPTPVLKLFNEILECESRTLHCPTQAWIAICDGYSASDSPIPISLLVSMNCICRQQFWNIFRIRMSFLRFFLNTLLL